MERWHPVTHDYGLIQSPLEAVTEELQRWHSSIGFEYQQRHIKSSLGDALHALLPLSNAKQRRLFVRTQSDWTACFQNGIQGSDPFPTMSTLAKRMQVLSMRVCATLPGATWPATIWEMYASESLGGQPPLNYRRSIAVSNDGGRWKFSQSGVPFDFERPELYESRRKKDRFPREVLCEYLEHFSIQPFTDAFFSVTAATPAILLQQVKPVVSMPEFTLEDVVAGKPWERQKK